MNMTKKLAKERFDGDQVRAIYYIIENYEGEQLEEYMLDFNGKQASLFFRIANCIAEYQEFCKKDHNEPTKDEENEYGLSFFLNNPKAPNPYSAKMKICILIMLGIIAALVAVPFLPATYIGDSTKNNIMLLLGIFSPVSATNLAGIILSYFRFRQEKKIWEMIISSHKAKED